MIECGDDEADYDARPPVDPANDPGTEQDAVLFVLGLVGVILLACGLAIAAVLGGGIR